MCGIVGKFNLSQREPVDVESLAQMLGMIRHRGPDEFGVYLDDQIGLGNARLSIIDLTGGQQPIHNEDESIWIVFNGEIFNYLELRSDLEAAGHHFTTLTDTEVIVHLYEEQGPKCVEALNGQFAIALWDRRRRELYLMRDRLGIRPIYYTQAEGRLLFASEVKALFADPSVHAELDEEALAQAFTFWTTLAPRSIFRDILTVPPGHILRAKEGRVTVEPYWHLDFSTPTPSERQPRVEDAAAELRELLVDATRLCLRADVPVGAYLSGGLDSSATCALVRRYTDRHLQTFGIGFSDSAFDEAQHQMRLSQYLSTEHGQVHCTAEDIMRVFPEVVWHAEMPLLRTAP
ncbi:MAG: asparagine synthase (glutamine-hydrolyzing), partial [Chloroflexi bacterium RBG_13_56_8]